MHTYEQIVSVLKAHGPTRGRLYDASCGRGESARALRELGFDVVCSTFYGKPDLAGDVEWHGSVDLNQDLPFEDESFDCAVLQEVIEHLENQAHVVREFNRVLKVGGRWVLTTPNASGLRSRVHFLLSGFIKGRRRPANYNVPPGNYANLFIPHLPTLHYLLWTYGFRVAGLGKSNRKLISLFLYVLLYPFVQWSSRYYTRPFAKYDSPLQREASADLRRLLLSPHVLIDENLVLLLEKRHGLEGLYRPAARQMQGSKLRDVVLQPNAAPALGAGSAQPAATAGPAGRTEA